MPVQNVGRVKKFDLLVQLAIFTCNLQVESQSHGALKISESEMRPHDSQTELKIVSTRKKAVALLDSSTVYRAGRQTLSIRPKVYERSRMITNQKKIFDAMLWTNLAVTLPQYYQKDVY